MEAARLAKTSLGELVAQLPDAEGVDAEVLGGGAGDPVLIEPWSDTGCPVGELLNEGLTLADCRLLSSGLRL